MANLDQIEQFNKGNIFPEDYSLTYIATKHISAKAISIPGNVLDKLKSKIKEKGLYFGNDDVLSEIVTGLVKGNIILQGPPGTGKTTLAKIICEVFNVDYDEATAISDWTTYDTIGGLQPDFDGKNEILTGKNGCIVESILHCCNTVVKNEHYSGEKQASWLILDELNRCEIDKVFGELFTVFGSDSLSAQRSIRLWYEKDENKKRIYIPDISIRYIAKEDALVMIDIKNRVRTAGANSEEIYKMIGYFGNFKKAFEERFSKGVKKQGALIFRNDFIPSDEYLESDSGYRLMTISAGISDNQEINMSQFKKLCKYVLDVQGIDGTTSEIMGSFSQAQKKIGSSIDPESDEYIFELNERNHATIQQLFSYGDLAQQLPGYKDKLETDHFPHVWNSLSVKTQDILAMAECLYSGVSDCETADYAPICLEYCRALEVEMNELIFGPFKAASNVNSLAQRNYFYEKLKEPRDMTLGECVYLLDKCSHRTYPLVELRRKIQHDIKHNAKLLGDVVDILRDLNETIRRLSAHTTVMTYDDLVVTRQRVLGIGNPNLFYVLRDSR